jgi:hypothetical protein
MDVACKNKSKQLVGLLRYASANISEAGHCDACNRFFGSRRHHRECPRPGWFNPMAADEHSGRIGKDDRIALA